MSCATCHGEGGWVDPVAALDIVCPSCRREEADKLALARNLELPGWVPSRWFMQAARYRGPLFQIKPWLLIIHNGAFKADVAHYFEQCGDNRQVSSHIAWGEFWQGCSALGMYDRSPEFRQCVQLNRVAWHAGGGGFRGYRHLNFCAIGIEGPGPQGSGWKPSVLEAFRSTLGALLELVPSIQVITGHRFVDENRQDPGPDFDVSILDGFGREVVWRKE